jgi:hypothetical protein
MAVGLRVPTLTIFNWNNRQHFHHHPWVECLLASDQKNTAQLVAAAERLLQVPEPSLTNAPLVRVP